MKFQNKNGVIVETRNMFEENILKSNPNYTEIKENALKNEKIVQKEPKQEVKTTKKGGNKPS